MSRFFEFLEPLGWLFRPPADGEFREELYVSMTNTSGQEPTQRDIDSMTVVR